MYYLYKTQNVYNYFNKLYNLHLTPIYVASQIIELKFSINYQNIYFCFNIEVIN